MRQPDLLGDGGQQFVKRRDKRQDQEHSTGGREQPDVDGAVIASHAAPPRRARRRRQNWVTSGMTKANPTSAAPYSGMKITCGVVKLVLWLLSLPYRKVTGPPLFHARLRHMNLPAGTFTSVDDVPTTADVPF